MGLADMLQPQLRAWAPSQVTGRITALRREQEALTGPEMGWALGFLPCIQEPLRPALDQPFLLGPVPRGTQHRNALPDRKRPRSTQMSNLQTEIILSLCIPQPLSSPLPQQPRNKYGLMLLHPTPPNLSISLLCAHCHRHL